MIVTNSPNKFFKCIKIEQMYNWSWTGEMPVLLLRTEKIMTLLAALTNHNAPFCFFRYFLLNTHWTLNLKMCSLGTKNLMQIDLYESFPKKVFALRLQTFSIYSKEQWIQINFYFTNTIAGTLMRQLMWKMKTKMAM